MKPSTQPTSSWEWTTNALKSILKKYANPFLLGYAGNWNRRYNYTIIHSCRHARAANPVMNWFTTEQATASNGDVFPCDRLTVTSAVRWSHLTPLVHLYPQTPHPLWITSPTLLINLSCTSHADDHLYASPSTCLLNKHTAGVICSHLQLNTEGGDNMLTRRAVFLPCRAICSILSDNDSDSDRVVFTNKPWMLLQLAMWIEIKYFLSET